MKIKIKAEQRKTDFISNLQMLIRVKLNILNNKNEKLYQRKNTFNKTFVSFGNSLHKKLNNIIKNLNATLIINHNNNDSQ